MPEPIGDIGLSRLRQVFAGLTQSIELTGDALGQDRTRQHGVAFEQYGAQDRKDGCRLERSQQLPLRLFAQEAKRCCDPDGVHRTLPLRCGLQAEARTADSMAKVCLTGRSESELPRGLPRLMRPQRR